MPMLTDEKFEFASLDLNNGSCLTGPWKFYSQGSIGAYPGFTNDAGDYVPMSAVAVAKRR